MAKISKMFIVLCVFLFVVFACCLPGCKKNPQIDNTEPDSYTDSTIQSNTNYPFFEEPPVAKNLVESSANPEVDIIILDQTGTERKISLVLHHDIAPITVENFLKLVRKKHYDGTIIHRLVKNFVIQGGHYRTRETLEKELQIFDPGSENLQSIIGEFNDNTAWIENGGNNPTKHVTGVISMARTSDMNSATDQFFLCLNKTDNLDGKYAAFGECKDTISRYNVVELGKSTLTNEFAENNEKIIPVPLIYIKSIVITKELDNKS